MRKIILIFNALCCTIVLQAQNKTYNGPYKLAFEGFAGTAVYDYKEVDDELLKTENSLSIHVPRLGQIIKHLIKNNP